MDKPVRIGVVGAGSIAVRGILPHLSQEDVQDRVRLEAVCDPVAGRAEAAAERFGVERAFVDYEDLLAKSGVDAVSIASCSPTTWGRPRACSPAGPAIVPAVPKYVALNPVPRLPAATP